MLRSTLAGVIVVLASQLGCRSKEPQPQLVPCVGTPRAGEVCIPGGEFRMGHEELPWSPPECLPEDPEKEEGDGVDPEGGGRNNCGPGVPMSTDFAPEHTVRLDPFFIDRYPVTNADYLECFRAGVCPDECQSCLSDFFELHHMADPRWADHPMASATIDGADAYCQWAGKRLPTEAEWERAARGPRSFDYPWGNDPPDCSRLLCDPDPPSAGYSSNEWYPPVGSNPVDVSAEGVHDMATGVPELLMDRYQSVFYWYSPAENPVSREGRGRVARGNIYAHGTLVFNGLAFPLPAWARETNTVGGIRCARSDTPREMAITDEYWEARQRVLAGRRSSPDEGGSR